MPHASNATITLHIGRHKTGTSSIQATLAAHRDLLRSRGVLYPSSLPENHSAFFKDMFHPSPENATSNLRGLTRSELRKRAETRQSALAEELATTDIESIILSGEEACVLPRRSIHKLKQFTDSLMEPSNYNVIFYTRHPISRAQSGIQGNVKRARVTFEDAKTRHLSGGGKRYAAIIADYAAVFGAEALTVRSFEAALEETGDIVTDFCVTAGIDTAGITPIRKNESIAAEIVHFLSWLYEGPRHSGEKRLVNRKTRVHVSDEERELLYGLKGAKADFLSAEDIDTLWSVVEDDMAFLEEHYGIAYRKPEATPPAESQLFSPGFMEQLETILPKLSQPLRDELKRFSEIQGVKEAR
ncbi:MAG: hypothetical protein HLUCCO07_04975 [Rhodobacteraceae bacterium HLUCCO07]|nr:MAG: hypothetical protein HLUCCO07_04975 [Rhodobacteraceae bacterium HLUCCO07]